MKMNRRNFLYGSSVALALPWMETFGEKKPKKDIAKRFLAVHHPDGVGLPRKKDPAWKDWSWFPEPGKTEKDFRLTKVLDVLEPLRKDICIYFGLSHKAARKVDGHSNGDQFLTGSNRWPEKNSISLDQVIAEKLGHLTRQGSLVMCTNGGIGSHRASYTISFNRAGRPIPGMNKPKQIFDLLFLTSGKDSINRLKKSKSALDLLLAEAKSLNGKISKHDKLVLEQYLEAVRDTEMKVIKAQSWINVPLPKVDAKGIKLDADPKKGPRDYIQSIYGLTYLAFLSDTTRIATYNWGAENSAGGIQDLLSRAVGLGRAHGLTHAVGGKDGWKNLGTYNRFQAEEFGRFIKKLKDTPEPKGNGTMLDNTLALHGSASSINHTSRTYPIITAGGKNLGFKNGRFINCSSGKYEDQSGNNAAWKRKLHFEDAAFAHLFITILERFGIETKEFQGVKGGLDKA